MQKTFDVRLLFCLWILCTGLLTGCGNQGDSSQAESPPQIVPPQVLVPEAPGDSLIGFSPLLLDVSNSAQGYLVAQGDPSSSRLNLQIAGPDEITYSYFLDGGETAVIPFTGGNGDYQITAYENISGTQYAALYMEMLPVALENEFLPYLYPNQYVDFTPDSQCSKLALSLLPEDASDVEVLNAIYDYVTDHVTYDDEKAATVETGYLPDVDETLETGTGICFDYAALMTAMLRSRDIPCKLQIGYSNSIKHAWIDVYIKKKGWVDKAIAFDGDTWSRMDPTFAASSEDDSLLSYIGDGTNYTVQFTR